MLFFKDRYLLKPFSPHLTIYSIQFSSIFSILHRLAALTLLIFIFLTSIFYFFNLNIFFYDILILNKIIFILFNFLKFFVIQLGFFHVINGFKIIFWKFTYLQNFLYLSYCNQLICIFFLFSIILN
uniref:Succinate dehydrogenase subunit 3 n=1 Tax=Rhodomelopsis africana TaxID=1917047 RepID=UPI0022FD6419|nr:Succinate dehydrogenase subunit 3 [Rhodomelopsis africana]WAX04073.1 Succinate dehydrogenase subunit 3 [Rhodomelopsis africana]